MFESPTDLARRDKQYVWHPFTQMQEWVGEEPLIIERGEGSYLVDTEGRRYLDGVSSLWVNVHGHRKAELDQALRDQLEKIAHSTLLGLGNVPAILLAERLVKLAPPGLTKVFYSDSGSTAVEVALKMAFQYWQQKEGGRWKAKTKFLTLRNAYHGDTVGAVSVGGIELFHKMYQPLLFAAFHAPSPYCYRCELGKEPATCGKACLDEVERIMAAHEGEIAAMIIEPHVQGAAGMITMPEGYVKRIRELCTQYRILMIADEVAVGLGRTGTLFACEQEGVTPDFLAVAKGLTGGYLPLAATLTTEEIYQAFCGDYAECKTFFHGHTYTGNPLACAVALANLDLFAKEKTLEKLQAKIEQLCTLLEPLQGDAHVGEIRQCGFIVGIELVKDRAIKETYPWGEKVGIRVCQEARRRGAILRPLGNVIVLFPPLAISREELAQLVAIVARSIQTVCHQPEALLKA